MISQDTIERVRQHVPIAQVVGERVKLQKRGRSLLGLCPFHKEKSPSFHVSDERNFYHCFGCKASGDALKFVQEVDGLSFVEAVRALAERFGIEVKETGSSAERSEEAEARRRKEELFAANAIAATFFERMLVEHPLAHYARSELEKRGLPTTSPDESIRRALTDFRLGYAPHAWDALADHFRQSGVSRRAAEAVGLLAPRKTGTGHYDRFRHRLMFAVVDLRGHVIAFSGRALDGPSEKELAGLGPNAPKGGEDAPAKYMNSPESPIYKKREALFGIFQAREAIRDSAECVLVEGNFDVVTLHAAGLRNVVAPLGTAFTAEQGKQVKRLAPTAIFLFDGDDAGRRATAASREPCREAGLDAKVAMLPDGADPDSFIREKKRDALDRVLQNARPMLAYLIQKTLDQFNQNDPRERAQKLRDVAALIEAESDPSDRALAKAHADKIAQQLDVSDATTFDALRRVVFSAVARAGDRAGAPARPNVPPPELARSRDQSVEIRLGILGAVLDFPTLLDDPEVQEALSVLEGEIASIIAGVRQTASGDLEQVLAKQSPAIHTFAAARLAAPVYERAEVAKAVLMDDLKRLERLALRKQRAEIVEELNVAEPSGDVERSDALLREHARRARERHGL